MQESYLRWLDAFEIKNYKYISTENLKGIIVLFEINIVNWGFFIWKERWIHKTCIPVVLLEYFVANLCSCLAFHYTSCYSLLGWIQIGNLCTGIRKGWNCCWESVGWGVRTVVIDDASIWANAWFGWWSKAGMVGCVYLVQSESWFAGNKIVWGRVRKLVEER